MKKKIWIFNHYAQPPKYETRVRNNKMAHYLQLKGYDVTIFSASSLHNTNINLIQSHEKYIFKKYDDLKFVHIKCLSYEGNGFKRKINMLLFPRRLYKYTKKFSEKPDIVINDLSILAFDYPFKIARRYKCPIITEVRDLWPRSIVEYGLLNEKSILAKFLYYVEKKMYLKSDSIIFSMEGGKDYIVEKGWNSGIDLSKVKHINNGVDLEAFNYNREHYQFKDPDLDNQEIFKVVYIGSIRKVNNISVLVGVAECLKKREIKKIKLLVYGDGNERQILKDRCIDERIDCIEFKGYVEKKYIPYILSKCNLNLLHGASSRLAKYGISLNKSFDYLASGHPTLSDIDANYDYILNNNAGKKVDCTSDSILQGILYFYHLSKKDYTIICKNAKKTALDYDYKNLTDKLIHVIEGD